MLTILEFAQIAKDVYQEPPPSLLPLLIVDKLNKKLALANNLYRVAHVDPTQNTANDFYAQLYIKFIDGKPTDAVVAYRGTDNWHNWLVDIHTWHNDAIEQHPALEPLPRYADLASAFYSKARSYLREYYPKLGQKMTHVTGHSLGGALAALMTTANAFPALAVTFNEPSIANIKGVDNKLFNHIYNVQARYDFISKIGKPCGKILLVDVPEKATIAQQAFAAHATAERLQAALILGDNSFNDGIQPELEIETQIAEADFIASAKAQHVMLNLLDALKLAQNTNVAYETVG